MCNHFELEDYVTRRIFAFTRAFCWKETLFFSMCLSFLCAIISLSCNCFVSDFAPRKLLFVRHYTCAHQSKVAHTSKSKGCACVMRTWLRFAQFITREARVIKIKRWYHNDLFERKEDDWFRECLRFVPNNDRCLHARFWTF